MIGPVSQMEELRLRGKATPPRSYVTRSTYSAGHMSGSGKSRSGLRPHQLWYLKAVTLERAVGIPISQIGSSRLRKAQPLAQITGLSSIRDWL